MIDDVMEQEFSEATKGSEPGIAWADMKEGAQEVRTPKLEHDAPIISDPPRSVSGIVVQQKTGLDIQRVTDLNIQIDLADRVARICQRLL